MSDLPIEVQVIVISGKLLHEMDSDNSEHRKEDDDGRVVEVVDAVYVFLHQNGRSLQLLVLIFVGLVMHFLQGAELLQLNLINAPKKQVTHEVGNRQ